MMLLIYLGTLAWQVVWFGLLPPPLGYQNTWLCVLACVPLLLTLPGVVRGQHRGYIWGGLMLLIYFMVGVTEAWANPPQRIPALLQVLLTLTYLLAFKKRSG